jgi:hypothetical protein
VEAEVTEAQKQVGGLLLAEQGNRPLLFLFFVLKA